MLEISKLKVRFIGKTPLIMNNGLGADPDDDREMPKFLQLKGVKHYPLAKKIINDKGIRKTKSDNDRIYELDFYSSLYLNNKDQVIVTSDCVEGNIKMQATEFKLGTLVKRAVSVVDDSILNFENMKKPLKSLYNLHKYRTLVKVRTSKIPRVRAIFPVWSFETTIEYLPKLIDEERILEILHLGQFYGFLDRRPKFGRYEVKVIK